MEERIVKKGLHGFQGKRCMILAAETVKCQLRTLTKFAYRLDVGFEGKMMCNFSDGKFEERSNFCGVETSRVCVGHGRCEEWRDTQELRFQERSEYVSWELWREASTFRNPGAKDLI